MTGARRCAIVRGDSLPYCLPGSTDREASTGPIASHPHGFFKAARRSRFRGSRPQIFDVHRTYHRRVSMRVIWRFFVGEDMRWRWQQLSVDRAVVAESRSSYEKYE